MDSNDAHWMARALRVAEQGQFSCMPNPMVGCVLVRRGECVAEAAHLTAGQGHAEVNALVLAGERAQGADAYVTLEPCSHTGRTGACADALIRAGVRRVIFGSRDPNPVVAGRGLARLRDAGIEVVGPLLESDCQSLNPAFFSRMQRQRPWVRLKLATTLDGKVAAANGESQWITSTAARADGHRWRARSCAILTGAGTVRADDPQLTVRLPAVTPPRLRPLIRCVMGRRADSVPASARLCRDALAPTWIISEAPRPTALAVPEVDWLTLPTLSDKCGLVAVLAELAQREVNAVLIEAGPTLSSAWLDSGLVDEVIWYMAPTVLGDDARGVVAWPGRRTLAERLDFEVVDVRMIGPDVRYRLRLKQEAETLCSPE